MGTSFGSDDKYIFDDLVLDYAWKFAPKDKKVAKIAKKVKGFGKDGQWRGLVLMYEAFKRHGWEPNAEMVIIEAEHALKHVTDDWKDKEEAEIRLRNMRDHMLDQYGAKKRAKELIECPFCTKENENGIEWAEGENPCLKCNGIGLLQRDTIVDCPFCEEPYKEKYIQFGKMKIKNVPCQTCGGTHQTTLDDVSYSYEGSDEDE